MWRLRLSRAEATVWAPEETARFHTERVHTKEQTEHTLSIFSMRWRAMQKAT